MVDGAAYIKWRPMIILIYRALLAHNTVVLFHMSSAKREQPLHWIGVLFKIAVYKSRVLVPMLHIMSFQVTTLYADLLRRGGACISFPCEAHHERIFIRSRAVPLCGILP